MERPLHQLLERLRASRVTATTVAAALLISYPLMFVAAALPTGTQDRLAACWLFLVAAVFSYLAELAAPSAAQPIVDMLNWLQMSVTVRFVLREAALMALLARVMDVDAAQFLVLTLGLIGMHCARAAYSALAIYVTQRRRLPTVTRNISLGELRIPDAPPRLLTANHAWKMLYLDVPVLAGGVVAVFTANFAWTVGGVAMALAAGFSGCAVMVPHALRNRHLGNKARVLAVVNTQVCQYRPEVVLYFSGSRDAVYQVNMWLATLARLHRPALVIMRERWLVPLLERTSLPVVCIDGTIDLMNFPLPSVRVALYPANTGKNIHLLRSPGIAHVFIGHGDSDKTASFNPFAKVYDQVWVAGRAGRDRYLRARVGVRDDSIIEVGRPQLMQLRPTAESRADRILTVLYAPTWEGWDGGDPYQTSLILMGPQIFRVLIDLVPPVRILYKPHPLTGTRDSRATEAHETIVAILEEANRPGAAGKQVDEPTVGEAAAAAQMASLEAELLNLTSAVKIESDPVRRGWPDYARMSRDSRPSPDADLEWQRLNDAWHDAYWRSEGWWRHRVVTGPRPTLYNCFNQSDLLISDVSSVVSDYIATGKPYVVTNPGGLGELAFRKEFPSAAAAYLLSADGAELAEICGEAAKAGDDRHAQDRRELKSYLLGPDSSDAQTRFNDAVDALAAVPAGR